MPIDEAISLYKDTRGITRGKQTNAIIAQLKKIETPTKLKGVQLKTTFRLYCQERKDYPR
jgi:hypothetical protein